MKQNSRVTHEEQKRWNKNVWKMRINVTPWAYELVRGGKKTSLEKKCIPSVELSERCSLSDPCSTDYLTFMRKGRKKSNFHAFGHFLCVRVGLCARALQGWPEHSQSHVRAIDNTAAPNTRSCSLWRLDTPTVNRLHTSLSLETRQDIRWASAKTHKGQSWVNEKPSGNSVKLQFDLISSRRHPLRLIQHNESQNESRGFS